MLRAGTARDPMASDRDRSPGRSGPDSRMSPRGSLHVACFPRDVLRRSARSIAFGRWAASGNFSAFAVQRLPIASSTFSHLLRPPPSFAPCLAFLVVPKIRAYPVLSVVKNSLRPLCHVVAQACWACPQISVSPCLCVSISLSLFCPRITKRSHLTICGSPAITAVSVVFQSRRRCKRTHFGAFRFLFSVFPISDLLFPVLR